MKKETVAAIVFGVVLGVGGATLIIGKAKQIENQKTRQIKPTKDAISKPLDTDRRSQTFEVSLPKNKSLTDKAATVIKGKASRGSLLVIQSPIKDLVVNLEKESFSVDFPLALGENVIALTLYPKDQQLSIQKKELKIYYLEKE